MIRLLTLQDRSAFRALRQTALDSHPEAYATTGADWRNAPDEKIDALLQSSAEGRSPIFGYFESRLLGMAGLNLETHPVFRHKAFLWGIYVEAAQRRKGAGRCLMEETIRAARAISGLEILLLVVTADNEAAIRLYEKCGFSPYGTERKARKVGDAYFDQLYMYLILNEIFAPQQL